MAAAAAAAPAKLLREKRRRAVNDDNDTAAGGESPKNARTRAPNCFDVLCDDAFFKIFDSMNDAMICVCRHVCQNWKERLRCYDTDDCTADDVLAMFAKVGSKIGCDYARTVVGARSWDKMMLGAARGGHLSLVREAVLDGDAINIPELVLVAAERGHTKICKFARTVGAVLASFRHPDVLNDMLRRATAANQENTATLAIQWGADNTEEMMWIALQHGHVHLAKIALLGTKWFLRANLLVTSATRNDLHEFRMLFKLAPFSRLEVAGACDKMQSLGFLPDTNEVLTEMDTWLAEHPEE